jgi:RNA polymerase sigma-70 factor (ECF subfamily)
MTVSQEFRDGLIAAIPGLRAFACSLVGRTDQADDLVQQALTKAWASHGSFEPGTNQRAWLFTILRNEFYSHLRKRRREVEDTDGAYARMLAVHPEQQGHVDLQDMRAALAELSADQREALLLVAASGFSYEEAADICEVAVGTIKSRVSRARNRLGELLGVHGESDFGPDATSEAVLGRTASGF